MRLVIAAAGRFAAIGAGLLLAKLGTRPPAEPIRELGADYAEVPVPPRAALARLDDDVRLPAHRHGDAHARRAQRQPIRKVVDRLMRPSRRLVHERPEYLISLPGDQPLAARQRARRPPVKQLGTGNVATRFDVDCPDVTGDRSLCGFQQELGAAHDPRDESAASRPWRGNDDRRRSVVRQVVKLCLPLDRRPHFVLGRLTVELNHQGHTAGARLADDDSHRSTRRPLGARTRRGDRTRLEEDARGRAALQDRPRPR